MNKTSDRRSWSWWRVSFWALALVVVFLWQGQRFIQALRPGPNVTLDFFQEWASAKLYFDGLPVYSLLEEPIVEHYLGQKRAEYSTRLEVNAHPPSSVLLALPFAALPYNNACLTWNFLSLATLPLSLFLVARQLGLSFSPWALLPALTLFFFCQPLFSQIYYGQLSLFLLLLIVAAWAAERSGRPWCAGALLGTAMVLKAFPALLVLPFLLRRRWDVVASTVLVAGAWTGVTMAVLGPGCYREYVEVVVPHLRVYHNATGNVSLTAYWQQMFVGMEKYALTAPVWYSPLAARVAVVVAGLIVVALVTWLAVRARARAEQDHVYALTITAALLLSPITWSHYFLLLLLPLALQWKSLPSSGLWRPAFWAGVIVLCLNWYNFWHLGSITAQRDALGRPSGLAWQAVTYLSLHHYALLGVFGLGISCCLRSTTPLPQPLWPAENLPETIHEPEAVEEPVLETATAE